MKKAGVLAIILLAALVHVRAQNTYSLSGTISSVSGTSLFVAGEPFTITITYLTGIADSASGHSQIGTYQGAIASYEFNYNNGAYVGTATNGRFFVYNNFELGTDGVQMDFAGGAVFPTVDGYTFNSSASGPYFFLRNTSGTLFSSDALPATFPTIGWNSGHVNFGWGEDIHDDFMPAISLSGSISSVSAVPEPGTYAAIAGAGALCAAILHRRRRKGAIA